MSAKTLHDLAKDTPGPRIFWLTPADPVPGAVFEMWLYPDRIALNDSFFVHAAVVNTTDSLMLLMQMNAPGMERCTFIFGGGPPGAPSRPMTCAHTATAIPPGDSLWADLAGDFAGDTMRARITVEYAVGSLDKRQTGWLTLAVLPRDSFPPAHWRKLIKFVRPPALLPVVVQGDSALMGMSARQLMVGFAQVGWHNQVSPVRFGPRSVMAHGGVANLAITASRTPGGVRYAIAWKRGDKPVPECARSVVLADRKWMTNAQAGLWKVLTEETMRDRAVTCSGGAVKPPVGG